MSVSEVSPSLQLRSAEPHSAMADENASLLAACRLARIAVWRVECASGLVYWPDGEHSRDRRDGVRGVPLDEALTFVCEAHRERMRAALLACMREGTAFDFRVAVGDDARPVRAMGEAVRDEQGRIVRVQGAVQAIAEQVRVEDALAQTAARLTATFESITDALFTLDREWRFEYVNQEAERTLRLRRDELAKRSVWDTFPDVVSPERAQAVRSALLRGETVTLELHSRPLQRWFDLKIYPSPDGFAVYFRDTTERRQTEEKLRLLHTCLERLHDVVLITDAGVADGGTPRIVYVNGAFERRHGVQREHVIGLPADDMSGFDTDAHDVRRVYAALRRGESFRAEVVRSTLAKGDVWTEMQVVPVQNEHEETTHFVSVERDISERKRTDDQLRLQAKLLDEARDVIVVRDLEHRIEFWNRSAERLLGWTAEEVMGRNVNDVLRCDPASISQAFAATLESGGWEGMIEKHDRRGQVLTLESRWTLLRDDAGDPRAILSIDTDVSARRLLEQQFLRAQRLESLGTLAGGIAHDLNNVLSPIMLSIDMLKARIDDEDAHAILTLIGQSAERGADMVGQVLAFARGAEGRRLAVQTEGLLLDVVEIARKTFSKGIDIDVNVSPDCWSLLGDATQLHQVLLNLCVNARDAMPRGGRLTVTAHNVVLDAHYTAMHLEARVGAHVCIEVTDTGTGIPSELLEKIFDPFFTTKAQGEGTGLGLATSSGIVRGHGGFMRVSSTLGKGTRMTLHLPASVNGEAAAAVELPRSGCPRGAGETILVIDDESAIREVTKHTLEAFGYRVILAADGPEAIALYAERGREIDLVLTDMMMPVMDGIATTRVLRRMNPDVLVVAASGVAATGKAAEAYRVGVLEFLPKPYTSDVLLHALNRALGEQSGTKCTEGGTNAQG